LSQREQLSLHRASEPCASCHRLMDPIGYALEYFAADGQWRTTEGGAGSQAIDAAGVLWDGTRIDGPVELREALLGYSPQFVRTFTEKLLTYALGRGVEYFDMPVIRAIVRDAEASDYSFSSIVLGIVSSAPFQMRIKSEAPARVAAAVSPEERG
jgi:hypothetical protein